VILIDHFFISQRLFYALKKGISLTTKCNNSRSQLTSYDERTLPFPGHLKKNLSLWREKEKVWLDTIHYTWPNDQECKHYYTQFGSPGSIPILGLASFPCSGNTWSRYLIEGLTGYYTGSIYNDLGIRESGMYGEGVAISDGLVMTVKTHGHTVGQGMNIARDNGQVNFNDMAEVNHTAILIIRNPFKALIAYRHFGSGGQLGFASDDKFMGPKWYSYTRSNSEAWLNFYTDWLENNNLDNILVLHYENLKENLEKALVQMGDFLPVNIDSGRLKCLMKFNKGHFKRDNKKKKMIKNLFTNEQKLDIKKKIHYLNNVLKKVQKEQIPLELYEYYNEKDDDDDA